MAEVGRLDRGQLTAHAFLARRHFVNGSGFLPAVKHGLNDAKHTRG
jgi:hypothetical protein